MNLGKPRFKHATRLTRTAVTITLISGMYLHVTRLFVGFDVLISQIYSATFDTIFAIPMLVGAICILPAWKQFAFRSWFEKFIVGFTGLYFWISIPLHVQTIYSQSTDYIRVFPVWYSFFFLAYTTVMLVIWLRVRDVSSQSRQAILN